MRIMQQGYLYAQTDFLMYVEIFFLKEIIKEELFLHDRQSLSLNFCITV